MARSVRLPKMSAALAGMLVSAGATLFVAVTAFRLAYAGSKGAAKDAGLPDSDAGWYPLCIEGALVVAAVGTVTVGGAYPWAMLLGFTALSVAANVAHTVDNDGQHWYWFHVGISAVPPMALPLCVHLMIAAGKHYMDQRASRIEKLSVSSSSNRAEDSRPDTVAGATPDGATTEPGGTSTPPPGSVPDSEQTSDPDPAIPDPVVPGPVHSDPVDPVHVDHSGDPDQGANGSPGHRSMTRSNGSRGPVDLTGVSDPGQRAKLIVDHGLLDLTVPELARRLGVSATTAKRDRKAARELATPLRVIR